MPGPNKGLQMHPTAKIFNIEFGQQIFDPFVGSIPRKLQRCVVYVIDMTDTPFFKIGSTSNPRSRLGSYATQSPFEIECPFILCPPEGISHISLEKEAHKLLSHKQHRGEWFNGTRGDAICAIIAAKNRLSQGEFL
jgi:hypothetical protein